MDLTSQLVYQDIMRAIENLPPPLHGRVVALTEGF